ncbi:hypothetical protein [Ureibacillus manganicus]|uniref:Uncharacterized protein n=1 Tax=Ureibacillus manganicus DSM 26584 TaxID=1384049 RepID=A0A0A3I2J8_9BACL|nr:hypothetical protein [Ureibacillus manganicus]KGR79051.1 hypothetical protein CD29_08570 [Ureibacillus manganicus DSM 26584]
MKKQFYKDLLYKWFRIKPRNVGTTLFAPIKIMPEYLIDTEKGQVTGVVKHNEKVYLTVHIDIPNKKTAVKGSLRKIKKHTKPFKKHHYIEMIKHEAEYLIYRERDNLL